MKNLSDINVVKSLLSRHGFQFSKALGQNFLINPEICPKMATECLSLIHIFIAVHGTMLPSVFGQIFSGAFNLQSATGGISGSIMLVALRSGRCV